MTTPHTTYRTKLSATETLKVLREKNVTYDPVEHLLRLQRDLMQLEQKYGLSSSDFYSRYQVGLMGDSVEVIGWAGRYRLFLDLRSTISESLNLVVALPLPAAA